MMRLIRQQGVTFVELVISIVIIGIAVSVLLMAYSSMVSRSADAIIREQALAVAEAYLDEIISKHFTDPDGVDGEGARANFDDVDDYNGLSEPPSRPDGSSMGLPDYNVTVSVVVDTLNGVGGGNILRVDVTVTYAPSAYTLTLSGYRANYGP